MSAMTRSKIAASVVASVLLTIGSSPRDAAAEPVVFNNSSNIFGHVTVLQNGIPVLTGNSFETFVSGTPQTWKLADTRTISALGATATITSSVNGAWTPNGLTGGGSVQGTAAAPAGTNIGARSWGRSVWNVSFELDLAHTFAYSATYFAESDGGFGVLLGRLSPRDLATGAFLPPIFTDRFQFFQGSLTETTRHLGLLQAGFYNLVLVSDPLFVTAPQDSFKNSSFAFSIDLTPVPEPASVLLMGAGLAGIAGRKLSRRAARKAAPLAND